MATDEPPKVEKGVDDEDSSAQTRIPTETQKLLKFKAHQGSSPRRTANDDSVRNFREPSLFRTGDYTVTAPLWSRLGEDCWFWEIGGICLSLGGILFICTFLMVQDDKPVPVWHYGLTLNTLISVLATLSKASLIMVVAATLDQNKWLWYYGGSQRLQDISLFSDASKGPFGSLSLLLSRRGSLMVWFGAAITICAIGFEPFLQQSIMYPLKEVPSRDQVASMRILSEIPGLYPDGTGFVWEPLQDGGQFNNSIKTGIYDGDSYPRTMPICPNGNCRWPRYHAIAFCSKCADVRNLTDITIVGGDSNRTNLSDTIHQLALDAAKNKTFEPSSKYPMTAEFKISPPTGLSTNAQIQIANWSGWIGPGGSGIGSTTVWDNGVDEPPMILINTNHTYRKTWSLNSRSSFGPTSEGKGFEVISAIGGGDWMNITIAGIPGPMVALGHLSMGWEGDGTEARAVEVLECALTPCLQEYEARVTNSTLVLDVLSTTYGIISSFESGGVPVVRWTATANGTTFSISDQVETLSQMAWYANAFLVGNVTQLSDTDCDISNITETGTVGTNCSFTDYPAYGLFGGLSASSETTQAIDAQAANFSQVLANVAGSLTDLNRRFYNTRVLGDVLVAEPFVYVCWIWLTLPMMLLLMTLITLSVTIHQTKRSRIAVWKSSILPLLYHGPQADLTTASSDQSATTITMNKVSLMEIDARRISVQLVKTQNGVWKLQQKRPCTD